MIADAEVIHRFLTDFPLEVKPRTHSDLDPDLQEKLDQFAGGGSSEDGRDELAAEVLTNPKALDYLAILALKRQQDGQGNGES